MKLTVYYCRSLGSWVAQCEQPYTLPWTYASLHHGWEGALTMGLRHLQDHARRKPDGSPSLYLHLGGDQLTRTNGRIP